MKARPFSTALACFSLLLLCTSLLNAQTTVTFKQVAKFTYPGADRTLAQGIDDAGNVVGAYIPTNATWANGFERYADGTLSDPIIAPGGDVFQTVPTAINNTGTIAGNYSDSTGTHGFLLTNGAYTVFDYPVVYWTTINGINDVGDFVGYYVRNDGSGGAFVSIAGNVVPITIPRSTFISPSDINNVGDIIGWYNTAQTEAGFVLGSDGTLHYPIKPGGYPAAIFFGMNERREKVGQVYDGATGRPLYYVDEGTFAIYDVPNTFSAQFSGINRRGLICGYGYNFEEVTYSFLVKRVLNEAVP
jgi:hypothetical protein